MKTSVYLVVLAFTATVLTGCGKDADDAASDEASAASSKSGPKLAPGSSAFGSAANPKTGVTPMGTQGPPTSPPPQMVPGQGMGSLYGKAQKPKDLGKDQNLPE